MISYLGTILKEKDTDEDFRIAKAMAKTEAKQYKEEIFKNLKYEKDMHEINLYRKEAMKRKEDIKKKQQEEDELFMKKKMETDLLYQMYEMEKSKKRQEALEIVAKNNRKLVKEKKELVQKEKLSDREYIAREMELMSLEDKQFEDYATNVIDYMDKHGRNTYPMKKVFFFFFFNF